jgi:hypothetical protein
MTPMTLHLTGPRVGGPSFEDLMALFTSLTGRDPTPVELVTGREEYDSIPKGTGRAHGDHRGGAAQPRVPNWGFESLRSQSRPACSRHYTRRWREEAAPRRSSQR